MNALVTHDVKLLTGSLGARFSGLHARSGWLLFAGALVVFGVVVPLAAPDYLIPLLGKFVCFGLVALALDLIWGFTGILSLGHGVFFALGGYAIGMHLMLAIGDQGVYRSHLPDFMVFLDWKELPWFWRGFDQFWFALAMAVVVPGAAALAFGFFAFRSRIRGVYFSIITQALTFALMLLFFRNETGLGGNNGLTDYKTIYGYPLAAQGTKTFLYLTSVVSLAVVYLGVLFVTRSKLGRVLRAIRDDETKVRFMGYDPLWYKLFAWTLSAMICGLAGALYVPQVGIINPSELQPANSIEMAVWVAVGGRGTLYGAVVGAFAVNGAKSFFTGAAPELWLYFLGAVFVAIPLALPDGLVSLGGRFVTGRRQRPSNPEPVDTAEAAAEETSS